MKNMIQKGTGKTAALKIVTDEAAATRLRELIKDADDGLRRVVKCGLYIEWLAANLPHGQLMPWVAANCPDVSEPTVRRWRTMAKNVCEWAGIKFVNLTNLSCGDRLLDLPEDELPPQMQKCRAKMDELLDSARTPKQLFFDMGFKQGELDAAGYPRAKQGRRKGEGGATKLQRMAAQQLELAAELKGRGFQIEQLGELADLLSNDAASGDPELRDAVLEAMPKVENLFRYWQRLTGKR